MQCSCLRHTLLHVARRRLVAATARDVRALASHAEQASRILLPRFKAGGVVGIVGGRGPRPTHLNKMDNYAVVLMAPSLDRKQLMTTPIQEPSLSEIMAAIKDLKRTIEPTLDAVTVDVTFLRTDFKKITEKMTVPETRMTSLQCTTKKPGHQLQRLTKENMLIVAKLEDQEDRVK
ncbi:hypothetical protein NDU88_002335 [Pleurodeles waltl]|uniref:Uncharacterized protein n=1 Tax=Pleurodeles waltl TaxID=8319 RepID=A0AAV7UCV5_PLEWA|nr:hypothetical protein NDU88_002335 [Pleurodeles waltl]